MTFSDPEWSSRSGRGRATASPAAIKQLLAVGVDRGRLAGLSAMTAPHVNLFVTSSPQKALLWTRLESLDAILLRFGPPVEQALDLVQALIEANPVPPILLLVEPEAEAVAQHLARRQICAAQPASITVEQLQQQVLQLLGPSPGRQTGPRTPAPMHPPTHPIPSVQPTVSAQPIAAAPPPPVQPLADAPAPLLAPVATPQHEPAPKPPMPHAESAAPAAAPLPPPLPMTAAAPTGWELPFLDQLVIELAHRLKNPLVSIKTFTHLLQERFNDADFRSRFYAIVNNDVVQLNDIVDRLLEFTEFSRPYPKLLTLADELRQARESIEPILQGRQMTIQLMAPESAPGGQAGPWQLHADPTQFRYLLKQLLLDSAMTAPVGGNLQVRLTGRHAGRTDGEPACAIVIDTVMSSAAPHLHEWLSLELLLAKNLMERHRGTVTVTVDGSGAGRGENRRRRVTATFPLQAQPRHDGHAHDGHARPAPSVTTDRRQIPLSIAFRERRLSPRRQEHRAITFDDRRRSPG